MGVILDTDLLIGGERGGEDADSLIARLDASLGRVPVALSAVSVVEITRGIYRAKQASHRERRSGFVADLFRILAVHPVTFEIALLAGRIHGEQMDKGISIDLADLLIGATALHLDYDLATLNVKHFQQIPGLRIVAG